ncbi:2-methylaconitate cis-trans isomerase PrpF family protein [Variovorax terrae]|uniref:PrpF family protein n=1 Tax=Variovorax terrae TaxID=2923278 RepID=A0A9X1VUN4_9BURK|nr:PrpF domain-containing protein [Variovorax terrae]MCJ0764131.1 PrpF family protein [Variovorax terrae]
MNALPQRAVRAVYVRGGTSRALVFHRADLPADRSHWDAIFLAALGSPDPGRRQLDGLGGGISSLSKVAIVGAPSRPDADVDYTFAQVPIDGGPVQYRGNCGNISSAIGPFALDERLVAAAGSEAVVRIHNTNTGKIIVSRFRTQGGKAAVEGGFKLQGVAGTGSPIRLSFLTPGGAATGQLLPTGQRQDRLALASGQQIDCSLIDAANPVVFAAAASLGLTGIESPAELEAHPTALRDCEELRIQAAVRMGLVQTEAQARTELLNLPQVGLLSAPTAGAGANIVARMISTGQPHRATPLTGAMCLAAAIRIPGTVAARLAVLPGDPAADLMIAHPTGTLPVAATVRLAQDGQVVVEETVVYRTARRLMEGSVLVPATVGEDHG